jgi:hypothetical protein
MLHPFLIDEAYLKEAELVGRIGRADDDSFHVPDINVSTSYSDCCKNSSVSEELPSHIPQRNIFFAMCFAKMLT